MPRSLSSLGGVCPPRSECRLSRNDPCVLCCHLAPVSSCTVQDGAWTGGPLGRSPLSKAIWTILPCLARPPSLAWLQLSSVLPLPEGMAGNALAWDGRSLSMSFMCQAWRRAHSEHLPCVSMSDEPCHPPGSFREMTLDDAIVGVKTRIILS